MSLLRDIDTVIDLFNRVAGALQGGDGLMGRDHAGAAIEHYQEWTSFDADKKVLHSDAGTFRSQVKRLFGLAYAKELPAFEQIARDVVSTCLTNRYYGPADYLSDVVDALESTTHYTPSAKGTPSLRDVEQADRRDKVAEVCRAWLDARKVASIETVVATHARLFGRDLPYAALGRFERVAARLLAMVEDAEVTAVEQRLAEFLVAWKDQKNVRARFAEPSAGVASALACLEGELQGDEGTGLRSRGRYPLRLNNAVPEDRQFLIEAAILRLGVAPPPKPAAAPVPKDVPIEVEPIEEPEDATGPLRLVLSCPKCGGAFTADDETVSVECEYCGSLLVLSAAERDEVYVDDDRFKDGADVLDTVVQYRVQAHRAELVEEYRRKEQDPEAVPPESWMRSRLQAFEQRLREASRVLRAERIYAPYWHLTGLVAQGTLGRRQDGPKVMRVRAWSVEHTVPGYEARFNLRDRGLRLSHSRVRPLTVEQARAEKVWLPSVPVPPEAHREVEKWRGQNLESGFEPIVKHGEILFSRRVLAYRPYWLAELALGRETIWVLADAVFRTVAGYPGTDEVRILLGARVVDPLRSQEASFRRVQVIASRCPDCGHEQHLERHDHVVVCPNCHRGVEATPDGIRLVDYDHLTQDGETVSGDYLPFWPFSFELKLADGTTARDLPGVKRLLFGEGGPSAWLPQGDALWVPAFRLLGSEPGDDAFRRLVECLHARRNEVAPGKIPLGLRTRHHGASLSAAEGAELARLALAALHGSTSAAQLNTMLFNKGIAKAGLTTSNPRLTMVPFDVQGQELALGSLVRVPALLIRGGPELEALRVSVHRVRRMP
jgi:DNA-directed RNA polymerase subunit RPC12/RpoP